jgi:hypothetical protein
MDARDGSSRGAAHPWSGTEGRRPSGRKARRRAANVSELCDLYLADAQAGRLLTRRKKAKKPSTLDIDKGRIERHIKPLLGRLKVTAVTTDDIDNFMHDVAEGKTAGNTKSAKKRGLARVRGGQTAATRSVGLLGGIFSYAVQHRMRQDNPVRGIIRFENVAADAESAAISCEEMVHKLMSAAMQTTWLFP